MLRPKRQLAQGPILSQIISIDDPDDPRTALYRDIRERDLVGRQGLFVAEGEVVLRILLGHTRHQIVSLFLADKRVVGLAGLLGTLPEEIPVYAASQAAMDAVVGFPLHRGILAIGRSAPEPSPDQLLAADGDGRQIVLALFGIANHDNMGGIFRNAAAFGAAGILLDPTCCAPLYRKAIRVGVGAPLIVPFSRLTAGEDLFELAERNRFTTIALSPHGSVALADLEQPCRAMLLLGAEGPGLPAAILERATTVRIPMARGLDSLNVATTSGIALHHLAADGG